MKKRFAAIFAALILLCVLSPAAFASGGEFVYGLDAGDVIDGLNLQAQELYDRFGVGVCYACTDTLGGMTLKELAESLYASQFAYADGILLLDCMEASSYYLYTSGAADGYITQSDVDGLCLVYEQPDTYADGVMAYLAAAEELLVRQYGADYVPPVPAEAAAIPASRQLARVVDNPGVLDAETLAALNALADEVSEKYMCDIAVALVADGAADIQAYADDFYDYNGYGYGADDDGVLLVVDVAARSYAISTYGYGAYAFTDAGMDYLVDKFVPYLRDSDWAGAAGEFLNVGAEMLDAARNAVRYDVDSMPDEPFSLMLIPIDIIIGLVLAFIPVGVLKRQLKSVSASRAASSYVRPDSFRLLRSDDRFLYRRVSKSPRPKPSNSGGGGGGSTMHTSSSGRSHGGRSGSF